MNSTSEQHLQALDRHGTDLHAVASVLTADPELAEHLVVVAVRTSLPDDDLGRLSGTVVRAWLDGHLEVERPVLVATLAETFLALGPVVVRDDSGTAH